MKESLDKFVTMIIEAVNINDYTAEDFVDVYITIFKSWVKENYGEQEMKYPYSYLRNKYEEEFLKAYNLEKSRYTTHYNDAQRFGRKFLELALHSYEEVPKTDSSWFDSPLNQKIWKAVEKHFKFPSYMKVEVVETKPRNLELRIVVDFLDYIKSPEENPYPTGLSLVLKIQEYMTKFGGVKFGNPLHNEVRLYNNHYHLDGEEEWLKKEFKEIKKTLKNNVSGYTYRGLKYTLDSGKPTVTILYSSGSWSHKERAAEEVIRIIRDMGYSSNLRIRKY